MVNLVFLIALFANGKLRDHKYLEKYNWYGKTFFEDKQSIAMCDAIRFRQPKKLEELIKKGGKVNGYGKNGMSLLIYAFPLGCVDCVEVLLRNGADPNHYIDDDFGLKQISLGGGIEKGKTFTHLSAHYSYSYFDLVFKYGGDANLPCKSEESLGWTPVHFALLSHESECMKRLEKLIELKTELNETKAKRTALDLSVRLNRYDASLLLLKAGANPFIQGDYGRCVSHIVIVDNIKATKLTPQEIKDGSKLMPDFYKEGRDKFMKELQYYGESFAEVEDDIKKDMDSEERERIGKRLEFKTKLWQAIRRQDAAEEKSKKKK